MFSLFFIAKPAHPLKTKQTTATRREDIINKPIGRLLIHLTLPMMLALIAIMGLGLVDSYFISFLGTTELAAIGFIVPITTIITSFGLGLGMAVSSLNSKLIGANNSSLAARLITDAFYLTFLFSLISAVFLDWQLTAIFSLIGADASTLPAIMAYMKLWVFAVPLVMLTMVSSSTFRSIGDTKASANISIIMTITNVILDPLLIFGIGPFPEMGMQGAALATVIAVAISTAVGLYQLGFKEKLLLFALPKWLVFKNNFAQLMEIAVPAVLANAIVPLTSAVLTTMVAKFGTDAVAGYGVGTRIEAVSLIVIYALSSTLPMFIGQNLGAGKPERIIQAIRLSFRFTLFFQLAVFAVLALFSKLIAAQFSDESSVQSTIVLFMWLVPISYGLSGVVILINVSMNVLGKPRLALYINIVRIFLYYLPFSYLGAHWFGLEGLFVGITLGNIATYFTARYILDRVFLDLKLIQS